MKKNKKFIGLLAALTMFAACQKDLLDTAPYGSISSGNMWQSENLADMGVMGVYNTLRDFVHPDWWVFDNYVGLTRLYFDELGFIAQDRDPDGNNLMLTGTINSTHPLFETYWKQNYEGIHRANDALANLPEKAPLTPEKRGRLIAEVKFLRALFYFNLNMVFKGVPVYLEPVAPDEANRPRETESKVWEVIINDLTDAINEPNLPNMYQAGDPNFGRATKAAAYALRGKAYLWMKDYAKAEADLRMVGTLGPELYQGPYERLFKEENEQHPEMIFSVQNIGLSGYGSYTQVWLGSRVAFNNQGWNVVMPAPDYVESFENADGTPFNWDDYIPGYTSMTPQERMVFFLRDGLTNEEKDYFSSIGADMSKYLDVGNEARIKQVYDNRDPRLKATIITPYSTFFGYLNGEATFTLRWPYRSDQDPVRDLRTDTNEKFYYLWRKWVYEGANETPNAWYCPTDQPLIRYADVVLMLAEAINEQRGGDAEAINLVNSIRQRAGMPDLTGVSGQEDLRERIRNERRWELAMEGINLFDEMRWGTWKAKKFYPGNGTKEIWGGPNRFNYTWKGDYLYTWPIPRNEVERNPNLQQTPGWLE
ncbi:MAG: RagB/SusD family nutrient uptake outer membrane protein [Bacteroidales bacterium]